MDEDDRLAERFEENRTRLRTVAHRMLGSLSEADDAVQEAWLRLSRSETSNIENLGAWLTTVVGRVCLDMLRARASRREEPMGAHVPEPVVGALILAPAPTPKKLATRPRASATPGPVRHAGRPWHRTPAAKRRQPPRRSRTRRQTARQIRWRSKSGSAAPAKCHPPSSVERTARPARHTRSACLSPSARAQDSGPAAKSKINEGSGKVATRAGEEQSRKQRRQC